MIDFKRRICRVKADFEKILNVVEKYEKKTQENDAKQGNNARSIECEQEKNAYCSEDFVKEINKYLEKLGKAEAIGSTSAAPSLYSSRLSHRPGSIETLSHASNQSNDEELLRRKEMVAQLELENSKDKEKF